jgi:hypothetical protein
LKRQKDRNYIYKKEKKKSMIVFEMNGKDYNLPENWNEVSLDMFRKIQRHSSILNSYKSTTQFALEMTAILLGGAPINDLLRLDRESYVTLSDKCEWVNKDVKTSKKKEWVIDGETYLPINDLNKMSMGDSISLELMINESDEIDLLPNMLPMLIRKGVKKLVKGKEVMVAGEFDADNYEQTKQLFLKNLMIADVVHLQSFFLNGENQSSTTTKASSVSPRKKKKTTPM